jgi:hypothetical protein
MSYLVPFSFWDSINMHLFNLPKPIKSVDVGTRFQIVTDSHAEAISENVRNAEYECDDYPSIKPGSGYPGYDGKGSHSPIDRTENKIAEVSIGGVRSDPFRYRGGGVLFMELCI